jgi:hypothetical protein
LDSKTTIIVADKQEKIEGFEHPEVNAKERFYKGFKQILKNHVVDAFTTDEEDINNLDIDELIE